jgi:hypothetical protein
MKSFGEKNCGGGDEIEAEHKVPFDREGFVTNFHVLDNSSIFSVSVS